MKFLKWMLIPPVIAASIGLGVYGKSAEQTIEPDTEGMVTAGHMDKVRAVVAKDPELEALIKEVETHPRFKRLTANGQELLKQGTGEVEAAAMRDLPIETKEEAIGLVIQRVGLTRLVDTIGKVKEGDLSKKEAVLDLCNEFSEEELIALKIITYHELYGK